MHDDGMHDLTTPSAPIRVLFICLGNICRSPMAEGVFRKLVQEAGLEWRFDIDSAGIGAWHTGEGPDERAVATAAQRGLRLTGTARQVRAADLDRFDYILAMDHENLAALRRLARTRTRGRAGSADSLTPSAGKQAATKVADAAASARAAHASEIRLFREFDPASAHAPDLDVPDPYYGGPRGFDDVYDLVERAARGLLDHICREHQL